MNDVAYTVDQLHAAVDRRDAKHWVLWLGLALVALNGADLVVTRHLLDTGRGHEANPVMAAILAVGWLSIVVKIGYPAWLGWRIAAKPRFRGGIIGLAVMCVAMCAVVAWNLRLAVLR